MNGGSSSKKLRTELGAFIDPVTSKLKEAVSGSQRGRKRKLVINRVEPEQESPNLSLKTENVDEVAPPSSAPSYCDENNELSEEFLEELDDMRTWNLDEKINDQTKYSSKFVNFLDAKSFDFKYVQENGFEKPLVFLDKSGLGMRVPSENFKVSDVKSCVGSKRVIDVVDVNTQKALTMTMKDWCEYYDSEEKKKDRLLNVISLEFSHTKLENYVVAPQVVRQLDWIETAWPRHLINEHTESTNALDKMKYPKVQKYVLMSIQGCYTDFHIDMGGTSVWYHILKGEKLFWLIPPTEKNLKHYEKWILSGKQSSVFFADLCDECERIWLKQGCTFMLPSGWIHAVYTSKDSLVFGGNFLHSFNIPMQLKVHNIETRTKVPKQYRYPFYTEIMWFVVERYVHCLTGVTHLDDGSFGESNKVAYQTFKPSPSLQLNKIERNGLLTIFNYLNNLNRNKRSVPSEIVQADMLLSSLQKILNDYDVKNEESGKSAAASGLPLMHWPKPEKKYMKKQLQIQASPQKCEPSHSKSMIVKEENEKTTNENYNDDDGHVYDDDSLSVQVASNESKDRNSPQISPMSSTNTDTNSLLNSSSNKGNKSGGSGESRKHIMRNLPRTKGSIKKRLRPQNIPRSNVERRRRVRCHVCEPCTRDDCGECKYCKDMKKFGGTGVSKQCCLAKQCLQPLLPTTTTCMLCETLIDRYHQDKSNLMFECEICFEIFHEKCFRKQYSHLNDVEAIVNEDLENCWKCPNCVCKGYIKLENQPAPKLAPKSQDQDQLIKESINNNLCVSSSLNLDDNSTIIPKDCTTTANILDSINTVINVSCSSFSSSSSSYWSANDSSLSPTSPNVVNRNNVDFYHQPVKIRKPRTPKVTQNKSTKKQIKNEPIDNNTNSDDDSVISLSSLTHYEKQIILREFCELCYDSDEDETTKKSSNTDGFILTSTPTNHINDMNSKTIIVINNNSASEFFKYQNGSKFFPPNSNKLK